MQEILDVPATQSNICALPVIAIPAEPYPLILWRESTALILIDMQRDFLEPGGFGEMLGNDVSHLRRAVERCQRQLAAARAAGLLVLHTREGHAADFADLHPAKLARGKSTLRIGDEGPMGRILIKGEHGQDIVPELAPAAGEIVFDKPGKGAFYNTALQQVLTDHRIQTLIVAGVTTEVCVHATTREANDRGYECLVVSDATASYFPEFHRVALEMITAQGGILGWVADSATVCAALAGTAT
jgi:nicotinamidase-related amidase